MKKKIVFMFVTFVICIFCTVVYATDDAGMITEYDQNGNAIKRYKDSYDQVRIGNESVDRHTTVYYDLSGNTLGSKEIYSVYDAGGNAITTTNYFDAGGNKTGSTISKSGKTDYSASGFSIVTDQQEITPGGMISATYSLTGGSGIYNKISYAVVGYDGSSEDIVAPGLFSQKDYSLTEKQGTLSFNTNSLSSTYYSDEENAQSLTYAFDDFAFEITIEDALWGKFTVVSPRVAVHRVYVGDSGWVCIDGKWYYGDAKGIARVGWLELGNGSYVTDKYYLNEDGILQTGWFQDNTGEWYYAEPSGRIEKYFYYYDALYIPDYVDSMDNIRLFGVKRDFILQCTPGSAAERYAKEHGIAYTNGSTTISGTGITNLNEKAKWVVDTYTTPDMSDMEKAKILHDWVIYNTIYDDEAAEASRNDTWCNYSNQSSYNAAGPLLYGTGVCDGYTKAYMMLLNQAGIENQYIVGPVGSWRYGYEGEGEDHAWNLVKIDGSWYHVDCTFDDQGAGYEYFLVSDEFMRGDHRWTASVTCGGDYAFGDDFGEGIGWKQLSDGSWIYRADDWAHHYEILTGTHEIDGVMYFFDSRGHLVTGGWCQSSGAWYYIDTSGSPVTDAWCWMGNAWYYFFHDGSMADGWQQIGNTWYYFDSGAMATGWRNFGGVWYYFTMDGAMADGWQNFDGTWYYFDGGAMADGWQQIGGVWYYFSDGAMVTGWKSFGSVWYYFELSGAMASGWRQIGGTWCYFNDGALVTGWQLIDGVWEMFSDSGEWLYTWQGY